MDVHRYLKQSRRLLSFMIANSGLLRGFYKTSRGFGSRISRITNHRNDITISQQNPNYYVRQLESAERFLDG